MKKLILSVVFYIALTSFTAAQDTSTSAKKTTSREIKKDKKVTKATKEKAEIKKTPATKEQPAKDVKISIPDATAHIKDTITGVPKKKEN